MESALAILKTSGVEGLSMRKVASTAGKSLNNVQHHFKNKDTLLNYLADFYLAQCYEGVEQYTPSKDVSDPKQGLYE
ncbi:TetR family transcriptional regulator, partial [Vibrio xuii]